MAAPFRLPRNQSMRPFATQLLVCAVAILHVNAAASQPLVSETIPAPVSSHGETHQATGDSDPQPVIKVRVVEVSLTNMRVLGVDFATLERHPGRRTTKTLHDPITLLEYEPKAISNFVDALAAENFAKVLAEPTIVTVVGRQASYFVGGEVPTEGADATKPTYRRIGTEVDITPWLIGKERLRMQVHTKVTELDRTVGTATAPGFRSGELKTLLDVDLGKTVAVGGPTQERMVAQKVEDGRSV